MSELKSNLTQEIFADDETRLYRLTVNHEQTERYGLSFFCILLGDDYTRLQITPVTG